MKKLLLVLSLFSVFAFAQTTEPVTPAAPTADAVKTEAPVTAPIVDADSDAKKEHHHGDLKAAKKNLKNEAREACLAENKELKGKALKKCVKAKAKIHSKK